MPTHAIPEPATARSDGHTPGAVFHFTIEHFLLLPIGGLIALIWANTRPESYFTVQVSPAWSSLPRSPLPRRSVAVAICCSMASP